MPRHQSWQELEDILETYSAQVESSQGRLQALEEARIGGKCACFWCIALFHLLLPETAYISAAHAHSR